ncbi:hypothetical protein ACM39_05225 [Chryseobacterium sp. FH2]|uniref:hypothetical protein n=1 Tax=Chryseobacterium sp. FH2 TaxID=1674291 RepID=UPI00065AB161|nr:hypothetical protein [Chryseobacterium sp. FH2]KMQ68698.1 hypothetical protein ACM39_05225 [Chryseobacterium sp. FH2]
MNWVIRSTKTIKFHTNLKEIIQSIWKDLTDYNWILTDLDFLSNDNKIPINYDHDIFTLNNKQFEILYKSDIQIIWGIISAIPKNTDLNLKSISTLSVEDEKVWKDKFLIPKAFVEIVAFDSSYTIVKFKDEKLSDKFKEYFKEEAIDLEKFNKKYF